MSNRPRLRWVGLVLLSIIAGLTAIAAGSEQKKATTSTVDTTTTATTNATTPASTTTAASTAPQEVVISVPVLPPDGVMPPELRRWWPRQRGRFIPVTIKLVDPEGHSRVITSTPEFASNEVIINFKSGYGVANLAGMLAQFSEFASCGSVKSAQPLLPPTLKDKPPLLTRIYRIVLTGEDCPIRELAERLSRQEGIEYAEPNAYYQPQRVPNDPQFPQQWHLDDPVNNADINAPQAWDLQTGSRNVIVALLDTGIDYTHPDLAANVWTNPGEIPDNNIDDDGNGYIDDVRGWDFYANDNDPMDAAADGHGTAVGGVIGAAGNNAAGVSGVCWNVSLMPLRVGTMDGLDVFAIAQAIAYATVKGAQVVNMSFGGAPSPMVATTITSAHAGSGGPVFVAAAANSNFYRIAYPAAIPEVVAVGATGVDVPDAKAYFSSYGAHVDLMAPGENILTTAVGGAYGSLSGTSLAAPIVSGVAALVLSQQPSLNHAQVENLLKNTADDLGLPGYDQVYGYGKVNAFAALSNLAKTVTWASELSEPFHDQVIGQFPFQVTGTALTQNPGGSYTLEWGAGTAPATWTAIATGATPKTDQLLGTFNPTGFSVGAYTLRLRVTDAALGTREARVTVHIERLLARPILLPYDLVGRFFAGGRGWLDLVENLDGDPAKEILTGSWHGDWRAFNMDGTPVPGWPQQLPCSSGTGRAIANFSASGELRGPGQGTQIVASTYFTTADCGGGALHVYQSNGVPMAPWPQTIGTGGMTIPTLEDLDGDGTLEIVFSASTGTTGQEWLMYAYHADGTLMTGWPRPLLPDPTSVPSGRMVAVGDMDRDGTAEILVRNNHANLAFTRDLWCFDYQGNVRFQVPDRGNAYPPPLLGNLDGDPELEVLSSYNQTMYAYEPNGADKWQYSLIRDAISTSSAMGYLGPGLGLGIPTFFREQTNPTNPNLRDEVVNLLDATGRVLPGFPAVFNTWDPLKPVVKGDFRSWVMADIDGDGVVELLFDRYQTGVPPYPQTWNTELMALHADGTPVAGFPKLVNGLLPENTVVTDMDGDGDADIVVGTSDFIYIFDTGAPFTAKPWPMSGHDNRRTNHYEPCGDGILTTAIGETCDDGNTVPGDGCSAACTIETCPANNACDVCGDPATPCAPLSAETRLTTTPEVDMTPDVSATHAVWAAWNQGASVIRLYAAATRQTQTISDPNALPRYRPKTDGDYAVWEEPGTPHGLMLYRISGTKRLPFPTLPTPKRRSFPAIHGNYVVWLEDINQYLGPWKIRLYDLRKLAASGDVVREADIQDITDASYQPDNDGPAVADLGQPRIVWADYKPGNGLRRIYMYDDGIVEVDPTGAPGQWRKQPDVWEDSIVWLQGPDAQVMLYDMTTAASRPILSAHGIKGPKIAQNLVVWTQAGQRCNTAFGVKMYDLATDTVGTLVDVPNANPQLLVEPAIAARHVVFNSDKDNPTPDAKYEIYWHDITPSCQP